MVATQRLDAIANFKFNPRTKRYSWADGAGKGQFAPKAAVLEQTQRFIVRKSQEMIELADRVRDGDLKDWQLESAAGQILKEIAIAQTFLGADGYENIQDEDWLATGRFLKQQYYAGRDPETGDRYGLRFLIKDFQQGKISAPQLKYRLSLYAQAGKTAFWEARSRLMERRGKPYAYRELGQAEHCPDCVAYAKMPPQPVASIVKPGEKCDCYTNCQCKLRYLTLEQAVKRGAKV